jgi:hypothetical protein
MNLKMDMQVRTCYIISMRSGGLVANHNRNQCITSVDVKSAPHTKHTTSRISWLHTRGPGVEIRKRASQFSLKLTKDEKQLDKTWNLPGGTIQFHIYGYKAS